MLQIDSISQFGTRDANGSIYIWQVKYLSQEFSVFPVKTAVKILSAKWSWDLKFPLSSLDPQKPRKERVQPKSTSWTAQSNLGSRLCTEHDALKQDIPLTAPQMSRAQMGKGERGLQVSQDIHPYSHSTTSDVL